MITITLTDEDILRLEVIDMDNDEQESFKFIKEKIIPEIKKQKGSKMTGHLDGGKGSMF
jgi:hypothetical protein